MGGAEAIGHLRATISRGVVAVLSPEISAARQTFHALLEPSSNAKISLIRTRPDTRSGNLARTRYPQCLIEPTWAEDVSAGVFGHKAATDSMTTGSFVPGAGIRSGAADSRNRLV